MIEKWDAYDGYGNKAGFTLQKGQPIPKGYYHLVAHVLVRHSDNDYLLTKRSLQKASYPGRYEASIQGSALVNETALSCAQRELYEETGIIGDNWQLVDEYRSTYCLIKCFTCIYHGHKDAIKLQPAETIAYKWLDEEAFISFIHSDEMIQSHLLRFQRYFKQLGLISKIF
ncbi:MAG: NUDIX hydrolase [Erysipelotrichaceae bacterium]|nr:NUDIX hydrolase [Erysipelotrichaceae bacterium]MDY5252361.1 NUDIX hydrolase [Erysipelotrichaceae bacterium]